MGPGALEDPFSHVIMEEWPDGAHVAALALDPRYPGSSSPSRAATPNYRGRSSSAATR